MTMDRAGEGRRTRELRIAGRVVLIDRGSGRLLLQLHDTPHEPHWAVPGGGAERGETARDAAARELREETGRADVPGEELFTWEHTFRFAGERVLQAETYYLAWTDHRSVPLTDADTGDGIVERAWMGADGIAALDVPVWPPDLATRLRALLRRAG